MLPIRPWLLLSVACPAAFGIFTLISNTGSPVPNRCADLSWSTPADLPGPHSALVRFGSIAGDGSRAILIGSGFHNFLRDTLSGSWVAYDTDGDVIPPPPGAPHWLPRAMMTTDHRLWSVWANTVATGPIPLTRVFGAPMRAVHAARWNGVAWEAHRRLMGVDPEAGLLVWDGEGDPLAVDGENRLHVALPAPPKLLHVRYDGFHVRVTTLLENNPFSPSIAIRGDTVLVAAIGARRPAGPRMLWLVRSDDAGVNWREAVPLDVGLLGLVQYLTVLWREGRPVLLWTQGAHARSQRDLLRGVTVQLQGAVEEWHAISEMQLPRGSSHLQVREDACGDIHVVFLQTDSDGQQALRYARYSGDGGWYQARIASPESGRMTEAMLGEVEDELWAVWAEGRLPEALTMRVSRLPSKP